MAIVRTSVEDVDNLPPEQPIMVDSDAKDNAHAVLEIERWCRARGLARVRENYLRVVRTPGGDVRRAVAFRPGGDLAQEYGELLDEIDRHVSAQPPSSSSVDLRHGA
jgi:hypothetical protein